MHYSLKKHQNLTTVKISMDWIILLMGKKC